MADDLIGTTQQPKAPGDEGLKRHLRRLVDARTGFTAILQTAMANLAVQAANVGCGVITARALGPAGRGALSAIIMWPQFLAYALSFGLPIASVYWIKQRPHEASDMVGAALLLSIVSGFLSCAIGVLTIPFSLHAYPHETIRFAQFAMLLCPISLSGLTLGAQVQSADNFKIYNLFRFLTPLSILLALGVEKLTGTLTPSTAALAYLLAGLPATVWVLHWVWIHYRPSFRNWRAPSRILLSYGMRAWGADLFSTVANQIDRVLVVGMLTPEAMGIYVVAQSAAGVLAVLPRAVSPVSLPKSSGLAPKEIIALTGRAARMTLLVMLIGSLPFFLCGNLLLRLVYGRKFGDASAVLPFLVIETILDGLTGILAQAFLAGGFPGTVTFLEACGLLTSVPLLYWMIPRFGLAGAGCALMLGTLMRFTFVLLNFPFRMKLPPPNLLIGRSEILALMRRKAV